MATTTEERRTVRAQVRYARVSPYKIREVLQLIRGRAVREAEESLVLSERDPAQVVGKCLASAVANAEHNDQIEESELFVAECYCDEGPTLKRWRPRARGRATRIRKRTSHVTVVLGRYTPDELQAIEDHAAAKGTGGRRDAGEDRRRRVAKSRGDEVDEVEDASPAADEAEAVDADDTPTEEIEAAIDAGDSAPDDSASAKVEADAVEAEVVEVETDADDGDGPSVEDLVGDNTKDELLALAEEAGVDVAKSANKTAIAEAIVAGPAGADEGDA
jgi:large subunit ribosomal protein L22